MTKTNQDVSGRTALVTGASAGIGTAIAEVCAARGMNLVLTARREERLRDLAAEFSGKYGVTVTVLAGDLANPATPKTLKDGLDARDIHVDMLVNNAGHGIIGTLHKMSWEDYRDYNQVMMVAPTHLTRLLLPDMIERGYGRILNVASVAGFMPGTHYGATKSFLIRFSEALFVELTGTGVSAIAVCPGLTYSEFHDVNRTRKAMNRIPKFMWMTAEKVAGQAVDAALAARRPVYVNGWVNRLMIALVWAMPGPMLMGLARRRARLAAERRKPRGGK